MTNGTLPISDVKEFIQDIREWNFKNPLACTIDRNEFISKRAGPHLIKP